MDESGELKLLLNLFSKTVDIRLSDTQDDQWSVGKLKSSGNPEKFMFHSVNFTLCIIKITKLNKYDKEK